MILVMLGTHELQFKRLLDEVQKCIDLSVINDTVIVQAGNTKYSSSDMLIKDFLSYEEMEQLITESDLIITHGGTGSIVTALKKGKKIIACPRLSKYKEHNDDHQIELIEQFANKDYIIPFMDGEKLENRIVECHEFKPKKFTSGTKNIISILENYIKNI